MNHIVVFLIIVIVDTASGLALTVSQDGSGDYTDLVEAITAASEGDTIMVHSGGYAGPLSIDKSITLLGAGPDNTFISASFSAAIAINRADQVTIEGFTITANSEVTALKLTAIGLTNASVVLKNNIISAFNTIECLGGVDLTAHYNQLSSVEHALKLRNDSNSIDARFNWWGTIDSSEIDQKIWDKSDDSNLQMVLFTPWMSSPEGEIYTSIKSMNWGNIKQVNFTDFHKFLVLDKFSF